MAEDEAIILINCNCSWTKRKGGGADCAHWSGKQEPLDGNVGAEGAAAAAPRAQAPPTPGKRVRDGKEPAPLSVAAECPAHCSQIRPGLQDILERLSDLGGGRGGLDWALRLCFMSSFVQEELCVGDAQAVAASISHHATKFAIKFHIRSPSWRFGVKQENWLKLLSRVAKLKLWGYSDL